jgi:hypothetical protein
MSVNLANIEKGTFVRVAAALGGIGIIIWSLWYLIPVSAGGTLDRWQALAMLAVTVCIASGVTAMLRFALAPLTPRSSMSSTASPEDLRSRIAPIVLSIGSVAIVLLALALIISFVVLTTISPPVQAISTKIDTLLTGVFTSVLPVLATWVGTVLAFYFGSENFRQAAQNTREALGVTPKKKITDVMIPFERIAQLSAESETAAGDITMDDVIHTMSEAASRVIIFNKATKTPIYVIRSSIPPMPDDWITADYRVGSGSTGKHVKDYLAVAKNQADAENFRFVGENATAEAALALMAKEGVDDVFITKDGQPNSRVLGWATSHDLSAK